MALDIWIYAFLGLAWLSLVGMFATQAKFAIDDGDYGFAFIVGFLALAIFTFPIALVASL